MPLTRRASSVFAGVLHVVLLHSSCIMAPLLLMLKALEERFADTCLRGDCLVLVTGPGLSCLANYWIGCYPKKQLTVYVGTFVTGAFCKCIHVARVCTFNTSKRYCPFHSCLCFGTQTRLQAFCWFPVLSVFSYSACPDIGVTPSGLDESCNGRLWNALPVNRMTSLTELQRISMKVFAGASSWGFWLRLVVLGLFCLCFWDITDFSGECLNPSFQRLLISSTFQLKSVIRRTKETSNVHPMYREGMLRRKMGPIIVNKSNSQDQLIEELQGKLGIGRTEQNTRRKRQPDDWLTEGVIVVSNPQRKREEGADTAVAKVD